ncbi:MAG: hypothetical protein IPJ68_05890 [Candidatus Moraniibacteriota bacterium]|nr:MAG: hypothetical protein IPJ68_05890 [Candidatus Moranbacteria bacterium]
MATVTANEMRKIMETNGFSLIVEEVKEGNLNGTEERSRFWFSFVHVVSRFSIECCLEHNLNNNRLSVFVGEYHGGFKKFFDFRDKENGPSAEVMEKWFEKLSGVLDDFVRLQASLEVISRA